MEGSVDHVVCLFELLVVCMEGSVDHVVCLFELLVVDRVC
jgi:hypothetical protein